MTGRLALLAAAMLTLASFTPSSSAAEGRAMPGGTIVMPHGSGLAMFGVSSGAENLVAVVPPRGLTGHAAWSPDGRQIALSRFSRGPGERLGGSDILVVGATGGIAQPAAEHDVDGTLLRAPAWAPHGAGLYYDYLPLSAEPHSTRVEYVPLDGSGSRVVAAPGAWPAAAPDGSSLVYVRPSSADSDLDELVLQPLDGGQARVLVPGGQFVLITSPRFAPDGRGVAFIGALTWDSLASLSFISTIRSRSALHGPHGDIWIVSLDGSPAWRRTAFDEDEPTLAWSPDGNWLVMLAGGGMYLVGSHDGDPAQLLGPGGFGGIDWR